MADFVTELLATDSTAARDAVVRVTQLAADARDIGAEILPSRTRGVLSACATPDRLLLLNLFRRGGSEKRKVGVLFSGGIDAVAVLVALRAWGVPCVAAVAGFTGGVEYVLGLSQILTKQCFISNAPVTVQTDGR